MRLVSPASSPPFVSPRQAPRPDPAIHKMQVQGRRGGSPTGVQGAGHPSLYTSMSPLWSRAGFSHTLNTPWSYKGGDAEAWGSLVTPALRGTHLSLCWAPQRHSWRRDPRRSPVVSESAHSKGLPDGGGGAFSREVRGQLDAREQTAPTPARGGAGGCCWASGAGEHRPGPEKGQFRQKAVCGFWRTDPPPGLGDWRAERGRARPPPPQTGRKVHEKFLGTEISRRGGVKAERPAGSEREGALRGRGTRSRRAGDPRLPSASAPWPGRSPCTSSAASQ